MKKESESYCFPEKLTLVEIIKIGKKINDSRLNYEDDLEYFFIDTSEGTIFIPKMKFVGDLKIEEYLKNKLEKLDGEKNI
ncbi:MAG: hypothetical protein PHZ07_04990 [Patescibacteria group bacterium]|nr:hypothetical protein [Patescibacteria group bacterium]MDD4304699.1 hypothetical protein [Patescibacteria group bacterium]MDD4695739.1 hypothetical protein [Patescibacteria group bacterium]